MIKAVGSMEDGRALIIVGLSKVNMDKLLKDQPIKIDLDADLGIVGGGVLLVVGGQTEATIQAQLGKNHPSLEESDRCISGDARTER
jgi:hypothetical protein